MHPHIDILFNFITQIKEKRSKVSQRSFEMTILDFGLHKLQNMYFCKKQFVTLLPSEQNRILPGKIKTMSPVPFTMAGFCPTIPIFVLGP